MQHACIVSFQITKPGNVEPSKIFRGYPGQRKYFYTKIYNTKILQHGNFQIYGMRRMRSEDESNFILAVSLVTVACIARWETLLKR